MTVKRRSLLLLIANALLCPACISINAKPIPLTPPEVAARLQAESLIHSTVTSAAYAIDATRKSGSEFAIFPNRPGETIPTKPLAPDPNALQKTGHEVQHASPLAPPKPPALATGAGPQAPPEPAAFPSAAIRTSAVPEPPLLAAVRAFIERREERALEHVLSLNKPNQDLVLALLPVLVNGSRVDLVNDGVAVAMLVEHLRAAAARLETRAALRVDTVAFCRTVYAFGRYDPWPKNHPYRPNDQALLYLEVKNLVSQPAVGPRGESYLTHVRATVEVRDAYGNAIPQPDPSDDHRRVKAVPFEKKMYSRSPIHDFHVLYAFPVPAAPGVYSVTVELRDASGQRVVKTAPAEFTVAGP